MKTPLAFVHNPLYPRREAEAGICRSAVSTEKALNPDHRLFGGMAREFSAIAVCGSIFFL